MNPYETFPPESFWKSGVSASTPEAVENIWQPKFLLARTDRVATAGSCFAQHIARHLRRRGYDVIDAEPPPSGLDGDAARSFGYLTYSARYGNIYAVRQLLQLVQEAYGIAQPADPIWEKDDRFYDALRPSVEPKGLQSAELVRSHRAQHLSRVRQVLEEANVFVFTFGLTEAWIHKPSGMVYPLVPGRIAGTFDPAIHEFKNFGFQEICDDFIEFRRLLKSHNPTVRILVTVSPVPLTATASGCHVLVATTYSKSVLRAAAGTLAAQFDDVDYFPSYELIASPFSRGRFYEDNLREVTPAGVEVVMRSFFGDPPLEVVDGVIHVAPRVVLDGDTPQAARRPERQRGRRRAQRVGAENGQAVERSTERPRRAERGRDRRRRLSAGGAGDAPAEAARPKSRPERADRRARDQANVGSAAPAERADRASREERRKARDARRAARQSRPARAADKDPEGVVCEEILLDAFRK
jgi:hypothetical protein